MNVAEYIASRLRTLGVTDAFGIPGGVILELAYAFEATDGIAPHLSYHEQAAGFAACGYAQSCRRIGVAYATRGPGFMNLLTPMADAYYDSLPTLFITAHASETPRVGMRVLSDQEIDTCSIVSKFVKFSARIDQLSDAVRVIDQACDIALSGRMGPVFLDIATGVLKSDLPTGVKVEPFPAVEVGPVHTSVVQQMIRALSNARRPVILVGDGVRQANAVNAFRAFASSAGLPILSSRFAHDVVTGLNDYFGYVGSHGMRAANFILSKADLVVSIGNRLNFPVNSASFSAVFKRARLMRFDVDQGEFERKIPGSQNFLVHAAALIEASNAFGVSCGEHAEWLRVCRALRDELREEDVDRTTEAFCTILAKTSGDVTVVSDVGNHEFRLSHASVLSHSLHRTLYSKSFGTMGCAIGKAIGAFYATRRPVLCFVGDQGVQANIQELQFLAQHRLPVAVIIVNNNVSGLIRDKELRSCGKTLHADFRSGFRSPDCRKIARAYGLAYCLSEDIPSHIERPMLVELKVNGEGMLRPYLPAGVPLQDLHPELSRKKFERLDSL